MNKHKKESAKLKKRPFEIIHSKEQKDKRGKIVTKPQGNYGTSKRGPIYALWESQKEERERGRKLI